ncbi:hypothetical protein Tco_0801927 [Tanacetum coccineum]|uniref:Transposase n=1 Tax=Tanacetum coccineum TaxID=301880 RepID=A0ABQ4ZXD5_9ASTR
MPCLCTKCLNHIEHKVEEVQFHLFKNRIDLSYTKWSKHGEKDEPSISAPKPVNAVTEFVDDTDFASDIPIDGPSTVEMVNATKDNFDEDDLVKFQELLLDAKKPLYKGCPNFTKLSAIVQLLNLKDSQAWRTIDEKFPEIVEDPRNLRLGISADGVDVNRGNRHHSVWPALTVICNLPPWLCMKRKFIILSVLISGYPGNDIDVFLEPLVDELHTLFETGVETYDASTKDNFNLHAVVLWTINDYPALGTLCGCPYSGFKGCVVCGKDTYCVRLSASPKQSYVGHKRYLPYNHAFRKQKKAFNGQQEFLLASNPMIGEQIYNERGEDSKQKRNTTEEEGSSSQVNEQNGAYWKKFNIWYRKLSKEIRLQELDKMQAELVVTLCLLEKFFPPSFFDIMVIKGHVQNRNRPEGCIAEVTIMEETIKFFSEYHKSMKTIGIPPAKHETDENEEGKQLSAGKSSEVSAELFLKPHLYVIQNTDEIVPYIDKSFAKWLRKEVERELAISKESVSETVRWISYGPRATIVKYDAYNINGYTFCTKCHDGKVYQNSGVSVEAIDLHISKEGATTRQAFYYGVLQEIWVLDYRFRQIPLLKYDWVNHRAGGVKRDTTLGYTLVDLNNLGHKVNPFILASQVRQVFYVKDQIDKKLSIVFKTPPKNYKDTYDEVDKEFSTVIHQYNDNILPHVDRRDLGNELRNDYYRTICGGVVIRKSN